jgi:hypothetical protein
VPLGHFYKRDVGQDLCLVPNFDVQSKFLYISRIAA